MWHSLLSPHTKSALTLTKLCQPPDLSLLTTMWGNKPAPLQEGCFRDSVG